MFQLLKINSLKAFFLRHHAATFKVLPLYDVTNVYISQEDLSSSWFIVTNNVFILDAKVITAQEIAQKLSHYDDVVLRFNDELVKKDERLCCILTPSLFTKVIWTHFCLLLTKHDEVFINPKMVY